MSPILDLRNNACLFQIYDDLSDWRARAVERISLSSALWADRRRSVQVEHLGDFLGIKRGRDCNEARLYLPVGSFSSGPLLDFDLEIAGRPAYLLSSSEHATLEADYMAHAAKNLGLWPDDAQTSSLLKGLIQAIYTFRGGDWKTEINNIAVGMNHDPDLIRDWLRGRIAISRAWGHDIDANEALLQYLAARPHEPFTTEAINSANPSWKDHITPIRECVFERVPENIYGAPATPSIVVSQELPADFRTVPDFDAALQALLKFINSAISNGSEPANALVNRYAEYGCYWTALADCIVPLDDPFLVKTSDRRTLFLKEPTGGLPRYGSPILGRRVTAYQRIEYSDAHSNHVNIRTLDSSVAFRSGFTARNHSYQKHEFKPTDEWFSQELVSFYSKGVRAQRMWLNIPLKSDRATWWASRATFLVSLIAFIAMLLLGIPVVGQGVTAVDAGVLLIPSAIAAALLLTRDSSSLGSEVNLFWHRLTGLLLIALWIMTLIWYFTDRIAPDTAHP
nr:hypothetical protein OH826_32955 [Streptomyces sp. NBC_00899]